LTYITVIILQKLNYQSNKELEFTWSLPVLLTLPLLIPLISRIINRNLNYSASIYRVFSLTKFSFSKLNGFRFGFELALFIGYVLITTYLTLISFTNFLSEDTLIELLSEKNPPIFYVIFIIHTAIYLAIRILMLPDEEDMEKLIKAKRKYWLWILAMVSTMIYIYFKIMVSPIWYDSLYFVFVLLITFDRVISSYKDLKKYSIKIDSI
jgi:hypothetical protein